MGKIDMKVAIMKIVTVIMALTLTLVLFGCSTPKQESAPLPEQEEPTIEYADEAFLAAVESGLYSRWDALRANNTVGSSTSEIISYIELELRSLDQFVDKDFENIELGIAAENYINTLNNQLELLRREDTWTREDNKQFLILLVQRSSIIEEFVTKHGMEIDDAHYADYSQALTQGLDNQKKISAMDIMDGIVYNAEFSLVDDSYGIAEYAVTLENTTSSNFLTFDIQINLLDGNGVVLESNYMSAMNWQAGTSVQFSFVTTVSFSTYEITRYSFEL